MVFSFFIDNMVTRCGFNRCINGGKVRAAKRFFDNLKWDVAELSELDIDKIQEEHNIEMEKALLKANFFIKELNTKHNLELPLTDRNALIRAVFNKRIIPLYEMINQALEVKIAESIYSASRLVKKKNQFRPCPECKAIMKKDYKEGYTWFCGACKKYAVINPDYKQTNLNSENLASQS